MKLISNITGSSVLWTPGLESDHNQHQWNIDLDKPLEKCLGKDKPNLQLADLNFSPGWVGSTFKCYSCLEVQMFPFCGIKYPALFKKV